MKLRIARKLVKRLVPRGFAYRRIAKGLWGFPKISGDHARAIRILVHRDCRLGRHRIEPVDRFQTIACCTICWSPETKRSWPLR